MQRIDYRAFGKRDSVEQGVRQILSDLGHIQNRNAVEES